MQGPSQRPRATSILIRQHGPQGAFQSMALATWLEHRVMKGSSTTKHQVTTAPAAKHGSCAYRGKQPGSQATESLDLVFHTPLFLALVPEDIPKHLWHPCCSQGWVCAFHLTLRSLCSSCGNGFPLAGQDIPGGLLLLCDFGHGQM